MRILPFSLLTIGAALAAAVAAQDATSTAAVPAIPAGKQATDMIPTGPAPKKQRHCVSSIYCPGPLLQAVQLAQVFNDSKTFVDKPTLKAESEVLSAFSKLGDGKGHNVTYQQMLDFVTSNFGAEGGDLIAANLTDFKARPGFLSRIKDAALTSFLTQVNGYWPLLARTTASTGAKTACKGCVSSFLPFEKPRTFVVPGGRFRELYYWDTYFVINGLLASELASVAKDLLMNFADLVDKYGFVPNGNRIYYLNRSQPPMLTQMVSTYIKATRDTSVLDRLLPLLVREMGFWDVNRTVTVTSPYSKREHRVSLYNVDTDGPRPESYLEDFTTVEMAAAQEPGLENLTERQRDRLYANLASGAESGMDYSAARWSRRPLVNTSNTLSALRYLNTNAIVPTDLNAILYKNEVTLSRFFRLRHDGTQAQAWAKRARARREAIQDLFWDSSRKWYYDFNTTAHARVRPWAASGFFPLWANILPPFVHKASHLDGQAKAREMEATFAGLRYLIDRYNGTIATTLLPTMQQWDSPNAWAPLTFIAVQALANVPRSLGGTRPSPAPKGSFALVPKGQFGLPESQLPIQLITGTNDSIPYAGVGKTEANDGSRELMPPHNVGNATTTQTTAKGEGWSDALLRELVNRYMASALCSWRATGGNLNLTQQQDPTGSFATVSSSTLEKEGLPTNATGLMFEKFSMLNINAAGSGGEYQVVTGFGWTNGVVLSFANEFGHLLTRPECPPIVV